MYRFAGKVFPPCILPPEESLKNREKVGIFAFISFVDGGIAMSLNKRGEFLLDDYGGWAVGSCKQDSDEK